MRSPLLILALAPIALAQAPPSTPTPDSPPAPSYILGAGDQLSFVVPNLPDQFDPQTAFRIDPVSGDVTVPLAGRIHAAGLTTTELESQIADRLTPYLKDPQVVATITEFGSKPVSVLGAVNKPGVIQSASNKRLFTVISLAEGLRPDAGSAIKITRPIENGPIPLPDAQPDQSGQFTVASVDVKTILNATDPAQNIVILPGDVISVSKADMIYAVGSVTKAGGFPLNQDTSLSALQILALAEGPTKTAALSRAEILRTLPGAPSPTQIPIDLKRITNGKAPDIRLQANDVLFVPNSTVKEGTYRALDVLGLAAAYGRLP